MQKSEQKAIRFCQYFSHFALPFPRLLRLLVQNLKGNKLVVPNKTNELRGQPKVTQVIPILLP